MVDIKQKPRLHASWIDHNAKEIVRVLQKEGFTSYLVGGCVRDLLAGIHPKDFDIATSAEPNQVKRKVWGSYVIGRRFRLVLVKRGDQQYEVATFRREMTAEDQAAENEIKAAAQAVEGEEASEAENNGKPSLTADNYFGTPEQDALRRDFTVNALFYDPIKDELIDYAQAMPDIEARLLRMIGNPVQRILEDPIRSLRAIRLSHKIGFKIEESLRAAMQSEAAAVAKTVLPRRREEYLKFLRLPDPIPAWLEMYDLGIMAHILPSLMPIFENTDRRDIFLSYIAKFDQLCGDTNNPVEVLTPLLIGFLRSMADHPDRESLLDSLLKDELMMFKAEQAHAFSAIDLIENLQNIESYKRKGARRQQAFLRNEALPLALRIAKVEHILPASLNMFWNEQLSKPRESIRQNTDTHLH